MKPDRDDAPAGPDGGDVEFLFQDLKADAASRETRPPRLLTARRAGVAVCLAIAAGAAFGFWTRPIPPPPRDTSAPVTAPARAAPFSPASATPSHVAPEPVAAAVAGRAMSLRSVSARPAPAPPKAQAGRPSPQITVAALDPPAAEAEPQYADPEDGPSFDCRGARSQAERMVCEDADLAMADRVLGQSYEMALATGVPDARLRAGQDDWRADRERAAHRSRDAVADAYARRIEELRALADERIE